ncbi:MAG: transcriptional activator RinB [Staphylococcus sp.]
MRILKTLIIITLYELSKYVTNEILIKISVNDEIDTPCDYDKDVS